MDVKQKADPTACFCCLHPSTQAHGTDLIGEGKKSVFFFVAWKIANSWAGLNICLYFFFIGSNTMHFLPVMGTCSLSSFFRQRKRISSTRLAAGSS
jgi:hypothetical protein